MNTQAIIAAAVESFDLGPEDQDAVLRFGMKLQDMESTLIAERDEAVKHLQYLTEHWSCEDGTITPFAEDVENAVNFLNTSAAMAEVERHSDECIGQ